MKSESFVSVVLVKYQPLADIENILGPIRCELDLRYSDYEVVVIGQGPATTFTQQDEAVLRNIPSLRYIQLSSRVKLDVALAVALENAIGDFVVIFNPDEDPLHAIHEVVSICKSGSDVVVGVAKQSRTLAYKMFRSIADGVLRLVDYSLPRDATGLRCLSRRAVNAVTSTGRFHHQLSMRIQKTGYPLKVFKYTLQHTNRLSSSRTFLVGVRDLLRLLVFNSTSPLRLMTGLGFFSSFAAFLFAVYSLFVHIINEKVVEGWTSTVLIMSAMFMMQFIILAFFGEYLGRLLDERNEYADYSVVFEKNSSVMLNQDRVNVLNFSISKEVNLVQTGRKC